MQEPPSSGLLQAAEITVDSPLLTTQHLLPALLLLALAAAFGAAGALLAAGSDHDDRPDRQRTARAAGSLQHLLLLAAATWLVLPPGPAYRVPLLALAAFLTHFALLAGARALAAWRPEALLTITDLPLRGWAWLTGPLINLSVRAEPPRVDTATLSEKLEAVLRTSQLKPDEASLIRNAVAFRDRTAWDLMVHRTDVVWLTTEESPEDAWARVGASGHSRFPLCEDAPDKVIGYVHLRDLAFAGTAPGVGPTDLRELARPVAFVPETSRAPALLRRFQEQRSHLAVVVDEFGGMAGILTLEDLLEELVGEIDDEFDVPSAELTPLGNGELLVDGGVRLEDLQDRYGLEFGEAEEDTVGGFIFGRLAREVATGDQVEVDGALLRVVGVEGVRVTRVRITPHRADPEVKIA